MAQEYLGIGNIGFFVVVLGRTLGKTKSVTEVESGAACRNVFSVLSANTNYRACGAIFDRGLGNQNRLLGYGSAAQRSFSA